MFLSKKGFFKPLNLSLTRNTENRTMPTGIQSVKSRLWETVFDNPVSTINKSETKNKKINTMMAYVANRSKRENLEMTSR